MEKAQFKPGYMTKVHVKKGMHTSQALKPKKRFETLSQQIDTEVQQAIQRIVQKMQNSKVQTLQPPYFQKTLTKFRQQSYRSKLEPVIKQKLSCQNDEYLRLGLKKLSEFVRNFDDQWVDTYTEQIREPYIRKIFNEGYEIDKVNFKKLNSEYELRKEIQEVLNQTSEWLIQLEVLEDVLSRLELYFGIRTESIMEKLKTEGASNRKGSWGDYLTSILKRATSFALRKGSRVVQNTGYASILSPAFAMLTWAVIGGNAGRPWSGGPDIKSLIIPIVAFSVPYMLEGMAETIQRSDFKAMLEGWAEQFQKINDSLHHFNQMLLKQIGHCIQVSTREQYLVHYTNLSKYASNMSKQLDKVSNYDEQTFQEMRERTKVYFLKFFEVEDGEWVKVMTPEQFDKYHKPPSQNQN